MGQIPRVKITPEAAEAAFYEAFQRRDLEVGIRDNGFVQVVSGIKEGERVATKGPYAVKLSSLAPAAFGHGHGH